MVYDIMPYCEFKMPSPREIAERKYEIGLEGLSGLGKEKPDGIYEPVFWVRQETLVKVKEVYAKLPEKGKRVPFLAFEVLDGWITHERVLKDRWVGYCDWAARALYFRWSPITFAHEWFHHCQVYIVPANIWKDWEYFWKENRSKFSSRGRASASEGFAEDGALTYLGSDDVHPTVEKMIRSIMDG